MKPKVLIKGDTIGIISPSSPSFNKSDLYRGVETLEKWGYKVKLSRNIDKKNGFFAGTDAERAEDFNEMFRRDDIDAVMVTRGGYGTARILKDLDFDAVKNNPKIFLGFSDITTLHLAINKLTGLVTFHGPGMCNFNDEYLTDYTHKQLDKAIFTTEPIGDIELADKKKYVHVINGGTAEGMLIGGNLSIICSTLGTPYEIETDGRVLMFEDLNTEPWVMDHMMAHMTNAGKFKNVKAIVIGECYNCEPSAHNPNYYVDTSIEDIFEEYLKPLGVPVIYGLPLGHTEDIATIPVGVNVRVDADNKKFTILESGVESK